VLGIADAILLNRQKKKMTRKELSEKSGIPQNFICNYEKGVSVPRTKKLMKIMDVLDMEVIYVDKSPTKKEKEKDSEVVG